METSHDDRVVYMLNQFIRIGVDIVDIWMTFSEPALWQYRVSMSRTYATLNEGAQEPFSTISWHAREHLEANLSAAWAMIWRAAVHLGHRDHVHFSDTGWKMYSGILEAAMPLIERLTSASRAMLNVIPSRTSLNIGSLPTLVAQRNPNRGDSRTYR